MAKTCRARRYPGVLFGWPSLMSLVLKDESVCLVQCSLPSISCCDHPTCHYGVSQPLVRIPVDGQGSIFSICAGPLQMMKVVITKHNKRYGIVKCDAKAYVGSELVCDAQLTLAMGS